MEMEDDRPENEEKCNWLQATLDAVNYCIEWTRNMLAYPAVVVLRLLLNALWDSLFLKQQPRLRRAKSNETLHKWIKDTNTHYCLTSTRLSFFDEFIPMNGIPAFSMNQQDSNMDGKHQYLHLGAGRSKNRTDIVDSSTGEVPIEVGTSSSNVERPVGEKTESALNSTFLPKIICCSFSVDSSRFAICYTNGEVTIWDSDHGVLMKKAMIAHTQANAVSFLGNSNNIVLICTQDYKCWKWDIDGGDDSEPTEFLDTKVITKIQEEELLSQRSNFFLDGNILVLSTLANCSEVRKLSIVLVHTTSETPMFIEHPDFLFPIEESFAISQVSMSPNGTGLLVGLMDEQMEDSYCIVWPDFVTHPNFHRKLDIGTMGKWSLDGEYVVTWTITGISILEDITRCSAFVWSIEEMLKNQDNLDYKFEHQMTNPFKEQVFWCQITKYEKGRRLIMGIAGETTRFLFWDMESMAHTHTIETSITTKDTISCIDEDWTDSYINRMTIKDLPRMDLTPGGRYFGTICSRPSALLVWDAILGVKLLEVSLKNVQIGHSNRQINLISAPSCRKFAIIGSEGAMMFCLSIVNQFRNGDKQVLEAQMIELKNECIKSIKDSSYKMKFSGDGNTLGVLCIGLSKMQLWNLPQGTNCMIDTAELDGKHINDFCLSYNGEHLAAYTNNSILVWKYEEGTMKLVSRIEINSEVVDMGIKDDGSKIVLCLKDGSILIYHKTSRAEISNVEHDNGTFACSPSREGNIRQHHIGPSSGIEEPLIKYDIDIDQTPSEDSGNNAPVLMEYQYEKSILAGAFVDATFQVSPSFQRVIRVSHLHAEEWNLESEVKSENAVVDTETICKSSEPYSRVSSISKSGSQELLSRKNAYFDGTDITMTEQTTVVQSVEKHIVVAANALSSTFRHRTELASYDVVYMEEKREDFHSIYIINLKIPQFRRRLIGRNLDPNQGLAISEDGRHVACFAGDFGSKIIVWNAYASESLLPDYHSLALNNAIEDKKAIKKEFIPMMHLFGINVFQFRQLNGMSVLDEAIRHFNYDLLKTILQYVSKKKEKISFLVPIMKGAYEAPASYCNMVDVALAGESPKTLRIVLKYLLK